MFKSARVFHFLGLALTGLAVSCTGQLGGQKAEGEGSGATGKDAETDPDEDLRAADPELHELALGFFPGQAEVGASPRLFRLTHLQMQRTTAALFPGHAVPSVAETMPSDPRQTNYEYAQNLSFNNANFTPYQQWVERVADSFRDEPEALLDCEAEQGSAECLSREARSFVTRAFRGVTRPDQLERFENFFTSSVEEVGLAEATADLATVVLSSPSYVFREEVLVNENSRLLPAQLLQSLTYTLADTSPEALGMSDEAPLNWVSDENYEATVDSILATPLAREKLLQFFLAWLEVKDADQFDISPAVFPEFTPEVAQAAVNETRLFLERMLGADIPTLHAVANSSESFVSEDLAPLYGISAGTDGELVDLDPEQRLGIFTQPAVLASHSGPTTTRLVKRGVFFVRKVMCVPLGAPPGDVETEVPEIPGVTEREIIETGTAAPSCAGCHAYINPFGFMLENYDAIGRWRTTDHGLPVNANIQVDFLEEGPLEASTPVEALAGFTASSRFKQCFTRQLFRYYMGRDETPADDPALRRLFFHFAQENEQDILRLLRGLVGSYSFTQRAEGL